MKISGALPKGKSDGISVAEEKVIQTRGMVAAMVILMPKVIDEDVETGDKQARMKIRSIEAILPEDIDAASRLMRRAFEKRTGLTTLSIELEDDLAEALRGVKFDAATGEVLDEDSAGGEA